jgi:hypothetical protein
MSALYTVDKPMQPVDYHGKVIDSVNVETPFLSLLPNGPVPKAWKDEWAVKKFPKAKNPAALEGQDKTSGWGNTVPHTLNGICEIMESEGWHLTEEAELLKAGYEQALSPASEQQAADAVNFAQSIERILLSAQEAQDHAADTKRLTRGVFSWLSPSAHAFQDVPAALRPSAAQFFTAALSTLDEAAFMTMLKAAYKQKKGKVNLMGYCGIDLKSKMSLFNYKVDITATLGDTRQVQVEKDKIALMVDTFAYDAGTVRAIAMNNLACDLTSDSLPEGGHSHEAGAFLDLTMWRLSWLMRINHRYNTNEGGGKRGYHKAIARLECLNPMGQMAVLPDA